MRRPLTGAILGFVLGLAIAVVLQQQGVWPLDQITVFLIPAITGVIGMLLLSLGREGARVAYVIAIILLIPALVWGALGVTEAGESGQLNGGCLVQSNTSVPDSTVVTDTSRGDPYEVDPQGSLHWEAASPTIFMDYDWEMWVEIGGIAVPFDSGHESNEGGSPANSGDIANIEAYAAAEGIPLDQLRGVFMVGGFASICDGFGFLVLVADGLTIPSIVAMIIAIIILIILIILTFAGRGGQEVVTSSTVAAAGSAAAGATAADSAVDDAENARDDPPPGDDSGSEKPGPAAEIAGGAIAGGYANPPPTNLSRDDVEEIGEAMGDGVDDD